MTDFERERQLFDLCVDEEPQRWSAFLDDHGAEPELRERVLRLLRHHSDTAARESGFLRLDPADPERIGPYRILQRPGEGGMGIVYAAEQREPVRRRVAIKVLRAGHHSREVLARFDAERQALSLMNHPGIARILDAGTTADQRPYIVMEYVSGEPITRYCSQRKPSLEAILELFRQVCDAVQHAHQKGVIHRDLKPSNILITEELGKPAPKIIDFGIAKALTVRLTEHTLETRVGSFLGTPDYMSPEQADVSPLDVDTRADVYALGAILYELLTGTTPLQISSERHSWTEIQKIIREQEPPPPGRRTPHKLPRELDWITCKALEKERNRRYATAAAFSEDITAVIEGRAPQAGPHTFLYRTGKLLRQHALAAATATTVFMLVLIFGAVMAWQASQIARERDRANQEADIARNVSSFLVDVLRGADPTSQQGRELTAREVLDRGVRQLEERFPQPNATRVALYRAVGNAYLNLGRYTEAEQLLQQALRDSNEVYGPGHRESLFDMYNLGRMLLARGRLSDALQQFESVAAIAAERLGPEHELTLRARAATGTMLEQLGRAEEAVAIFSELLPIMRRALGTESISTATALTSFGSALETANRFEEALPVLREAAKEVEKLQGRDHPNAIGTRFNVANALMGLRELDQAEALHREVLADQTRILGPSHANVYLSMRALAEVLREKGELEEALGLMRAAYLDQETNPDVSDFSRVETKVGYAHLLRLHGNDREAEPLLREAVAELGTLGGDRHWLIGKAWLEIALIELARSDAEQALISARSAIRAGIPIEELKRTALGRLDGLEAPQDR